MLNIRIEPRDYRQIMQGDIQTLANVLENEINKGKAILVEQANIETFRFTQGQVQALEAVHRLLSPQPKRGSHV